MRYTFQIQWPAPFAQGWKTSGRTWPSARLAAEAMAEFLIISLDNGVVIEGRLKAIE